MYEMTDEQWERFKELLKQWDTAQNNEQRKVIFDEVAQIVKAVWQPIQAWIDENYEPSEPS